MLLLRLRRSRLPLKCLNEEEGAIETEKKIEGIEIRRGKERIGRITDKERTIDREETERLIGDRRTSISIVRSTFLKDLKRLLRNRMSRTGANID